MMEWILKFCETYFSNVKSYIVGTHKYCQRRETKAVYIKPITYIISHQMNSEKQHRFISHNLDNFFMD